jgi:hypothetical protein
VRTPIPQHGSAGDRPTAVTARTAAAGRRGWLRFLVHLTAMVALMYVGMLAFDPLYGWVAGRLGSRDPGTDWPVVSALAMAAEMTIPMVPFMRWHGHAGGTSPRWSARWPPPPSSLWPST